MTLEALLRASGLPIPRGLTSMEITGVTCDSRQVGPGNLFVAVRGVSQDGRRFIPEAVERGARVIVAEPGVTVPPRVAWIPVEDARAAVAALAHAWFGDPARDLTMIGVTGTNGKTTVTSLIQAFLERAGCPCGLIGTIEYRAGLRPLPSDQTTPGPVTLAALFSQMRQAALQACAIEVSSHALDQRRVAGIAFHVAVFTNASPEHLDYHRTFEAYVNAKSLLFTALPLWGTAVLNADDPASRVIRGKTRARVVTFGLQAPADVRVVEATCTLDGSEATWVTPQGRFRSQTRLVGFHNLSNLAAAVAVGSVCEISPATMAEAIEAFPGVPGRLEPVVAGQPFPVFVDYAHTDDALEKVLSHVRRLGPRRVIVVFGCGGDRDRTKRPRMGAVASRLADRVVITSDNPRSESPERIADAIVAGLTPGTSYTVILDRAEAIRQALIEADAECVVVIAGKGHETTQIFADRTVPFDDRQVVRQVLARLEVARA